MIRNIEITETGIEEDRIIMLERKVRDLEPLVRGLAAEVLGLKAGAFARTRQGEERTRPELTVEAAVPGTGSPEHTGTTTAPAGVIPEKPAMVRIMQADGTMEMEPRFGETKTVDVSAGYVRTGKDTSGREK